MGLIKCESRCHGYVTRCYVLSLEATVGMVRWPTPINAEPVSLACKRAFCVVGILFVHGLSLGADATRSE